MTAKAQRGRTRAATVLLALDSETAAAVVSHMDPELVQALVEGKEPMSRVEDDEIEATLTEFERLMRDPTKVALSQPRTFLGNLAGRLSGSGSEPAKRKPAPSEPMARLRNAQVASLAALLAEEHPQVASAIVSQLPVEQASKVLMAMPEEQRVQVLGRLSTLEKIPKSLVSEASAALADALSEIDLSSDGGDEDFDGPSFAANVLKELPTDDSDELLDLLEDDYADNVDKIRDAMFSFEDLAEVSDRGLQLLLREVSQDQLLPALKTASPELVDRLFSVVSSRAAETLREDLSLMAPMRLADVEEAQKAVLEVAFKLAEEGRIQLPRGGSEEMV